MEWVNSSSAPPGAEYDIEGRWLVHAGVPGNPGSTVLGPVECLAEATPLCMTEIKRREENYSDFAEPSFQETSQSPSIFIGVTGTPYVQYTFAVTPSFLLYGGRGGQYALIGEFDKIELAQAAAESNYQEGA